MQDHGLGLMPVSGGQCGVQLDVILDQELSRERDTAAKSQGYFIFQKFYQ